MTPPTPSTPPGRPAPSRGGQVVIGWLIIVVVLATAIGAGWYLWPRKVEPIAETKVAATAPDKTPVITPPPAVAPAPAAEEKKPEQPKPIETKTPVAATEPPTPPKPAEPPPAPVTTPMAVTPPPKAEPVAFPFDSPSLLDPKAFARLVAETRERVKDGRWEEHLARLEKGLLPALTATAATDGIERHTRLWKSPYFALGMTQTLFIRQTTPEALRMVAGSEPGARFLGELMADAEAMEKFALSLKPSDQADKALLIWASLSADDAREIRGKYVNLQIATALVFDQPLAWQRPDGGGAFSADALTRYRFFRANAEAGKLARDLRRLEPGELVWVVGANATEEELAWALAQPRLRALAEWGPSYGMIRYRIDYVTREKTKLPAPKEGTLREILDIGGICVHQAHFAANTARAYGIPAAFVTGEGNRGGHAWFAYLRKNGEWNMDTGRYDDGYACGRTIDPQTGRLIGEFEVQILGDPQRRTERFTKAGRFLVAADVYLANGQPEGQRECLRLAIAAASRHLGAWREYASCLEDAGANVRPEEWTAFVTEMRRSFEEWPDMRDLADEMERKHLFPRMSEDAVYLSCKRAYDRLAAERRRSGGYDRTRYDLIQKAVARESAVLMANRTRNADRLVALHRRALEENADHLPTFRILLEGYYQCVKGDERLEGLFLAEIERIYKRRIGGPTGDIFRMKALLGLLDLVQGYFDKCGDPTRAKRLQTEADKLRKTLDKTKQ